MRCIGSLIRQRNGGGRGVAETAQAGAGNSHARRAVRIGTGDLGIGGHPVVAMTGPLLGRQQRQHRRKRIDRHALAGRQNAAFRREGRNSRPVWLRNRSPRRAARLSRHAGHRVRNCRLWPQTLRLTSPASIRAADQIERIGNVLRQCIHSGGLVAPIQRFDQLPMMMHRRLAAVLCVNMRGSPHIRPGLQPQALDDRVAARRTRPRCRWQNGTRD